MDWAELTKGLPADGLSEPLYAFGVHKCGSTLMHKMLESACGQARIPVANIPRIAFQEGLREAEWSGDRDLVPIFERRLLFCGFRALPEVLLHPRIRLRDRRFVLLVRDPRDALVSQFYSFGGKHLSHKPPAKNKEGFLRTVQATADLDIDDYVVQVAGNLRKKLVAYREGLDFTRGLVFRYEDIFFDKQGFLGDIFKHFELAVDPQVIEAVARQHDIRPTQEDISKHIRKGTPGDHREKLKPETIRRLNRLFAEVASGYGYDLRG